MGCGVSRMMNADRMDAPSPAHGGRMIQPKRDRDRDRDETIQYPASPSFREYFKQNDSQGEIDGVKSMSYTSKAPSLTKVSSKKEKNKEGKKKRLLSMGHCCSAQDVSFHRLPEKPMAA
ncbi:PREDICTED: uncharacterized protein LOC109170783 [Ipomoea nil]|uniref:uncharacterized protein LOC109170783 n=1 Tax=Ipomoea nil TaxID=35883 RepID=UPI00090199D4|nr:PREDICTED: uncharacterized protein LOC109170783 [Ipomoea nil]